MAIVIKLTPNKEKELRILFTSKPIKKGLADKMKKLFQGEPTSYSITKSFFEKFLSRVKTDLHTTAPQKLGIAILPGKNLDEGIFNLAFEGIRYIQDVDDLIDRVLPISDDEYFGILSNDLTNFKEKADRSNVQDAIKIKDNQTTPYKTKAILVTFDALDVFMKGINDATPINFSLARDRSSFRLTVILEGQSKDLSPKLMLLDDHDLIPPPDVTI